MSSTAPLREVIGAERAVACQTFRVSSSRSNGVPSDARMFEIVAAERAKARRNTCRFETRIVGSNFTNRCTPLAQAARAGAASRQMPTITAAW